MTLVLLRKRDITAEGALEEVISNCGSVVDHFSRKQMVVEVINLDRLVERATNSGIQVFEIVYAGDLRAVYEHHSPSRVSGELHRFTKDLRRVHRSIKTASNKELVIAPDSAYVIFNPSINSAQLSQRNGKSFKNAFYGNVELMCQMIYIHENAFGHEVSVFVDPFLGHGGSLISGIECGVKRIVGIEVDAGNFKMSKQNLEGFLALEGLAYDKDEQGNSKASYSVWVNQQETRISLFRNNSLTDGPSILQEQNLPCTYPIISDIPWGCYKCLTVGVEGKVQDLEGLDRFYDDLTIMIQRTRSDQITLAHNHRATLALPVVKVVKGTPPYKIVSYKNNPQQLPLPLR